MNKSLRGNQYNNYETYNLMSVYAGVCMHD